MNHFDDRAPLSKVGIAAMLGMMFGLCFTASGAVFLWHGAVRNVVVFLFGLGMVLGAVKIACSDIAYKKDVPEDK